MLAANQEDIQTWLPTTGLNAGLYLLELTIHDAQGTILTVMSPKRVCMY
jgi:hypothetical protein